MLKGLKIIKKPAMENNSLNSLFNCLNLMLEYNITLKRAPSNVSDHNCDTTMCSVAAKYEKAFYQS